MAGFSKEQARRIGEHTGRLDFDERDAMHNGVNTKGMELYHFVTPARLLELRQRALKAARPVEITEIGYRVIGEYMHALQDSYFHQSNPKERDFEATYHEKLAGKDIGHAYQGHWPDQTWTRPELAMKMAEDTFDSLRELRNQQPGQASRTEFSDISGPVRDFVKTQPELYPQMVKGYRVLDVRDYSVKIKKLDASYEPMSRERRKREDDYAEAKRQYPERGVGTMAHWVAYLRRFDDRVRQRDVMETERRRIDRERQDAIRERNRQEERQPRKCANNCFDR